MIAEKVERLIESRDLTVDGGVLAEIARNLAAILDDDETAAYVRPGLIRQLRETTIMLSRYPVT